MPSGPGCVFAVLDVSGSRVYIMLGGIPIGIPPGAPEGAHSYVPLEERTSFIRRSMQVASVADLTACCLTLSLSYVDLAGRELDRTCAIPDRDVY
jgi:hypothetical protein